VVTATLILTIAGSLLAGLDISHSVGCVPFP
jgi:hypothetical protein